MTSVTGSKSADRGARRREAVLRTLREMDAEGSMSIVDIADQLAVHPNTVRFHLERLTAANLVESVKIATPTPGRPALRFRARAAMDPDGPRSYRLLAELLVESLERGQRTRERSLAAGRSWGRRLADVTKTQDSGEDPLNALVRLLVDLGFAPNLRTQEGEQQITLSHCPFLELADTHREVICPIHLGLMRGVLERTGQKSTRKMSVVSLEPFIEPDLCLVRIGTD